MKRLVCGGVALLVIGLGLAPVGAADEETPTIKQIMVKLTKGKTSLTPTIGKALKEAKPDWPKLETQSAEFAKYAGYMEKNDPPKGSKDEWKTAAKVYADDAVTLEDAVKKKDKTAALAAHEKLAKSCMGCHQSFKGK